MKLPSHISGYKIMLLASILMTGCVSPAYNSYVPEYKTAINKSALEQTNPAPVSNTLESLFAPLQLLYSDLKHPELEQRIDAAYAESLYFNDTFHTWSSKDQVTDYLTSTANRVTSTTVQFDDFAQSGTSVYVRWTMQIELQLSGRLIATESIGVSQFRFDEQGKVIFHQDFWDNTEGFFRHIPVVGYVVGKTMANL